MIELFPLSNTHIFSSKHLNSQFSWMWNRELGHWWGDWSIMYIFSPNKLTRLSTTLYYNAPPSITFKLAFPTFQSRLSLAHISFSHNVHSKLQHLILKFLNINNHFPAPKTFCEAILTSKADYKISLTRFLGNYVTIDN